MQRLVLSDALLTAVGRTAGVTAGALPQVADSEVFRTIVVLAVARVPGLRLKGGGRGGLCEGNTRDRGRAGRGSHTPLALPRPGHTNPGSSQAASWRDSVCNRIGEMD